MSEHNTQLEYAHQHLSNILTTKKITKKSIIAFVKEAKWHICNAQAAHDNDISNLSIKLELNKIKSSWVWPLVRWAMPKSKYPRWIL